MSNEQVHPILRPFFETFIKQLDTPAMNYWLECASDACESAGISASSEQVRKIAESVKISHENYGMAFPVPSGNPVESEVKRLRRLLAEEKEKVVCKYCGGSGRIVSQGPSHSSNSECLRCRGEGRRKP